MTWPADDSGEVLYMAEAPQGMVVRISVYELIRTVRAVTPARCSICKGLGTSPVLVIARSERAIPEIT